MRELELSKWKTEIFQNLFGQLISDFNEHFSSVDQLMIHLKSHLTGFRV